MSEMQKAEEVESARAVCKGGRWDEYEVEVVACSIEDKVVWRKTERETERAMRRDGQVESCDGRSGWGLKESCMRQDRSAWVDRVD